MIVLLNVVGLTQRLLPHAPRLSALAAAGWAVPAREVVPAVTCTAQAAVLTGRPATIHGIVGNGWHYRDTGEVRFWQQSNRLIQAEPLYETARREAAARGRRFRCAKLFWWFNQGAAVDISVTPKPYYGADGNKIFGILGTPDGLAERLERRFGPFPFASFWGPRAGLPATEWIAACAAEVLRAERPDLTLVYLPHLDYNPQRFGPDRCNMPRLVRELDDACVQALDAAREIGGRVWVMSEYHHVAVHRPVLLNRALRRAGLLAVRDGPFGENLDTFASRAFAVCDHQVAHLYLRDPADRDRVRDLVAQEPGVARVLAQQETDEIGLCHPRAGDLVALAEPDSWFAYPFWVDDRRAPDYARTVDIHRKPGYDPCELFLDPALTWPSGRAALRLVQKKLGFRTLFDVIPLDPAIVRGSHGLPAADPLDRPLLFGDGPALPRTEDLSLMTVHRLLLQALELLPSEASAH
jgi:predicted AlkP superfamily pyrophosphatase or phosphodiesterase